MGVSAMLRRTRLVSAACDLWIHAGCAGVTSHCATHSAVQPAAAVSLPAVRCVNQTCSACAGAAVMRVCASVGVRDVVGRLTNFCGCASGCIAPVPDGCSITVAGEERQWVEGEPMLFDDSYEHHVS